jgi:hypothetical protein
MGESDQSIEKKVSSSAKLFVLSKLYFQRKDDHNGNKPKKRNATFISRDQLPEKIFFTIY